MLCRHPFMRDPHGNIKWWKNTDEDDRLAMTPFPCGKCLPCRINKRRIWIFRNTLEDMYTPHSYFITLTYNDERIPKTDGQYNLEPSHIQSFFKRLRKNNPELGLRYFSVGEYGDSGTRRWNPHFHLLAYCQNSLSQEQIETAWSIRGKTLGFVHVGQVEKGSISYTAGYTIKKLTDKRDHRLNGRRPEFMFSSRKGGGIGAPAIRAIGKNLRSNSHFTEHDIMQSLQVGGKNFPIGGYLTRVLADTLGVSQGVFKQRLFEYQTELLLNYYDHSGGYYNNIVGVDDQSALNQKTKFKIFGNRRKL